MSLSWWCSPYCVWWNASNAKKCAGDCSMNSRSINKTKDSSSHIQEANKMPTLSIHDRLRKPSERRDYNRDNGGFAFFRLTKPLWIRRKINVKTRICIATIQLILLYCCETWLRVEDIKKPSFDHSSLGYILEICWADCIHLRSHHLHQYYHKALPSLFRAC